MASLKETAEQLTESLGDKFEQLRSELQNGEMNFDKLTSLADEISEQADGLAQTFSSVNDALMERINQTKGESGKKQDSKSEDEGESGSSRKQEKAEAESGSRS
jgi:hypothetical protein